MKTYSRLNRGACWTLYCFFRKLGQLAHMPTPRSPRMLVPKRTEADRKMNKRMRT